MALTVDYIQRLAAKHGVTFPMSVWSQSTLGWSSRPATRQDWLDRLAWLYAFKRFDFPLDKSSSISLNFLKENF